MTGLRPALCAPSPSASGRSPTCTASLGATPASSQARSRDDRVGFAMPHGGRRHHHVEVRKQTQLAQQPLELRVPVGHHAERVSLSLERSQAALGIGEHLPAGSVAVRLVHGPRHAFGVVRDAGQVAQVAVLFQPDGHRPLVRAPEVAVSQVFGLVVGVQGGHVRLHVAHGERMAALGRHAGERLGDRRAGAHERVAHVEEHRFCHAAPLSLLCPAGFLQAGSPRPPKGFRLAS